MIRIFILTTQFVLLIGSILFAFVFGQTAFSISKSTSVAQNNSESLGSQNKMITLKGNETLITNNTLTRQNISYIEGSFQIIGVNKTDSHAGVVWSVGNQIYYAFLRPSTSLLSIYTPKNGEFLFTKINPPLEKGIVYTLKISFANDGTNVFLDNVQKIHIPQNTSISPYLFFCSCFSKIGIRSFNTISQFEPLKIVGK